MDNRTDVTEDFQSTPEHLPNQVGNPQATKIAGAQTSATPGALRQAILDAEHDAHLSSDEHSHAHEWPHFHPEQQSTGAAGESTWRSRLTQRAQLARSVAAEHPLAFVLIAIGLGIGAGALMRSRHSAQ